MSKTKIKEARIGESPYETFVRRYMEIYNAGGNLRDIAAALDTTRNTVANTASRLRKAGVRIPMIRRNAGVFSAAKLNRIISRSKSGGAK